MHKLLISMMALLLAGCVNDSASFYIDGRDHALTVLRAQRYFWSDDVTLTLVAARLPDCQRRHELALVPVAGVAIDVLAAGDQAWILRSGSKIWRIDNDTCTISDGSAADAMGERVGSFKIIDQQLRFEATKSAAVIAR